MKRRNLMRWIGWPSLAIVLLLMIAQLPALFERRSVSQPLSAYLQVAEISRPAPASAGAPAPETAVAPRSAQTAKLVVKPKPGTVDPYGPRLAWHAQIEILVGDVGAAIAAARRAASGSGGVVVALEETRPSQADEQPTAQMTISVPSATFQHALDGLDRLGKTRSRNVTAEDLGDRIVDTQARLRNLRRTEADLLGLMDRSGRLTDVLAVQEQLSSTRDEIEKLDAERAQLEHRVAQSTIELNLSAETAVTPVVRGPFARLAERWQLSVQAALDFGIGLVGLALTLIAFAPYLIAAVLLVIAARAALRRRARAVTPAA